LTSLDKVGDQGKMYIDRIQQVCKRMQDLINDILEFSKISSEDESLEDTDLNLLLNEVLSELETQIQEKDASIINEGLPVLKVNPILMRAVFSNLIGNAVKYSRKNVQQVIRVSSDPASGNAGIGDKEKDAKYCRIFIEDKGIGFDQKYAKEIFDMFRRLHPSAEFEGTGIGLALCKKIIEKHHGFISARSKKGEGATFIISLPSEQFVEKNKYDKEPV
jgi:signal transduction histidine kinase